jgi:RHS repeat-associated protein
VYFAGIMVAEEGNAVVTDRLGSVRSGGPNNLGYQAQFPYGVEYAPTTANDREKYATYTRDSLTGLDYAMNRYYSSQWGRFLSPDPYRGSVAPGNPQSWNRYRYAAGDPVNRADPTGLYASAQECIADPTACEGEDAGTGPVGHITTLGWPCGPDADGTLCAANAVGQDVCGDTPSANFFDPAPAGPDPCAPSPPPSWKMFVVATSDCYRPFFGKPGVCARRDLCCGHGIRWHDYPAHRRR